MTGTVTYFAKYRTRYALQCRAVTLAYQVFKASSKDLEQRRHVRTLAELTRQLHATVSALEKESNQ